MPRSENEVVVYTSVDGEYAAPILDAFDRESEPTNTVRQFDIEASKTVGLATRLLEEKDKARCDVFWNNEILHTVRLQKAGLLAKRRWKIPDSWPAEYRASDGTWVGYAARARVLLINTEKLPDPATWPKRVEELADAKWSKSCGLAFPLFGTTATHFAVLSDLWPEEKSSQWFTSVAKNAIVLSGNKQVAQAVSSGQLSWCLTDTDDALVEKENGGKVAIVFPDQGEGELGTLFIPSSVSVIAKSPHPIAAGKLADYLTSSKTEERLVMGTSAQFPLWPDSKERDRMGLKETPRRMKVQFEQAAGKWDEASKKIKEIFQRR